MANKPTTRPKNGSKPANHAATAQAKKSGGAQANSLSRREQLRQQQLKVAQQHRTRMIALVASIVVLVTIAGIAVVWAVQSNAHKTKVAANTGSSSAQVVPPDAAGRTGITYGTAASSAPLLLIYEDPQCPICSEVEKKVGPLVQQGADQGLVRVEYRTLTFLDTNLNNDSSVKGALALACSDVAGSYLQYHTTLFNNQPKEGVGYTDQQLTTDFAAKAGITGDKLTTFQKCYDSKATSAFVTDVAAQVKSVSKTPTYMVGTTELDNNALYQATTVAQLMDIVRAAAAKG